MNPRAFCREPGYEFAIALSFSFDPAFFETIVLHDLRAGGSGTVVVLGDPHEIEGGLANSKRHLEFLGRRYMLSKATHERGAFHPKILIRVGDQGGMILIGSGNLTSGGWGGNLELGTAWKVGPGQDDTGEWLKPLLASVIKWCSGTHEISVIQRLLGIGWIDTLPSDAANYSAPILFSRETLSLAAQLSSRWSGRRFSKLTILTGSSDRNGAFIRWAHQTFGVEHFTVVGTLASLSFVPSELAKLPVKIEIVPVQGDLLHAKFYWFTGPQGSAAIFGSANCSAAAWLLPPNSGGNVESIVCFDEASIDDFADVLAYSIGDVVTPQQAFSEAEEAESPLNPEQGDQVGYRLTALTWNARFGTVTFSLYPAPPIDADVALELDGMSAIGRRVEDAEQVYFQTHFDHDFREGALFGFARITAQGQVELSSSRWVDCIVDLDHARAAVRTVEPLLGLEEDRAPNEQRRLISAIQMVIDSLFSDAANFPDPAAPPKKETPKADENSEPAELLDPAKILCSLSDDDAIEYTMGAHRSSHPLLTLSGILRLLFADTRRLQDPPTDPDPSDGEDSQRGADGNHPRDKKEGPSVDERNAQRLVEQVNTFFTRLEEAEFAETCSAAQFVQAIAFPLAVAELGRQNGWVTSSSLEHWATRLFHLLFRRNAGKTGLLHDVWKRYQSAGRPEIFSAAVGDGALWSALVAAVANSRWEGIAAGFEKALAIRELFRTPILLGAADKRLLSRYSIALRAREATTILRQFAPEVVMAFEALEALVEQTWHEQAKQGMVAPCPADEGNLLWRPNVGWAFGLGPCAYPERVAVRLKGKPAEVMKGFYLNVTKLADHNEEVSVQIRRINDTLTALEGGPLVT